MYKLPSGFIFCKIGAGSVSFPLLDTFKTGWISTTLFLSSYINVCCKVNLIRYVCEGGGGGGGGGGGTGGSQSPASRTFLSLCFPTPTLYCVSPVIM